MKYILMLICILLASDAVAGSNRLDFAKSWLSSWAPESFELTVASSELKFKGCKQKEYQLNLHHPITKNMLIESTIAYAKGKLSWGVFSQKTSFQEFSIISRYKLVHDLSVGFGVVAQSAVDFKSAIGVQIDLPQNTEWLLSARTEGPVGTSSWELSLSRQKWQASSQTGTWYETGSANSKINLMYVGYF